MNLEKVKAVADAVLYEGYILYPYRPSAMKNRQRWTFGGVFPRDFEGRQGDSCVMRSETLLGSAAGVRLDVHVRFLQMVERAVGALVDPVVAWPPACEPEMTLAPRLKVGDREYTSWDEAVERELVLKDLVVDEMAETPRLTPFSFAASRELEPIRDYGGVVVAVLARAAKAIEGVIEVAADEVHAGLMRVSLRIENTTPLSPSELLDRDQAQRRAFVSTHAILATRGGAFVSLFDPPAELREAAARCENRGAFPVLVGEDGASDAMLSSPIILYDYPQIAPESPGDLFDGTEIDEILTLRILAMTDAEKREMAAADPRGQALLERIHAMTPEKLRRLHGAMRGVGAVQQSFGPTPAGSRGSKPRLASLVDEGVSVVVGSRVRIRPKPGGDILDIALKDQIAVVEAIERDFEDRVHLAVTLVDDPGRDLGAAGFPGHRFYFSREEVEPVAGTEAP
jgi:hypothetical protein